MEFPVRGEDYQKIEKTGEWKFTIILFLDVIPVDAVVLRDDVDTVVGGLLHHKLVLHQELLQPGGVLSLVTDGLQEYSPLTDQQPLVGLQFIFLVGRLQHLKYLHNTTKLVMEPSYKWISYEEVDQKHDASLSLVSYERSNSIISRVLQSAVKMMFLESGAKAIGNIRCIMLQSGILTHSSSILCSETFKM